MDTSITVGFLSKTYNTNAIIFASYGVIPAPGNWSEFIVDKCHPVKTYKTTRMLPKLSIVLLKITATYSLDPPMCKLEAIYSDSFKPLIVTFSSFAYAFLTILVCANLMLENLL